jgi:hypothetical protein
LANGRFASAAHQTASSHTGAASPTGLKTAVAANRTGPRRSATRSTTGSASKQTVLLAFVGLAGVVLAVGQFLRHDGQARVTAVLPAASALPPVEPPGGVDAPATAGAGDITGETAGPTTGVATTMNGQVLPAAATISAVNAAGLAGAFTFVSGYGPVLGTAGTLRRFKVAVETTIGQGDGGDFADEIDRTLGDPRSWIASRQLRLQRVPQTVAAEFTIYLASARTSERMCAAGGLATDGYTSCRLPGRVIINADRWQEAVPDYDAPISTYRAYAINHEVGHQLGHGHEACPGKGRPAPVMQQQTYGLKGCVANAWPYVDGKRYAGAPIK